MEKQLKEDLTKAIFGSMSPETLMGVVLAIDANKPIDKHLLLIEESIKRYRESNEKEKDDNLMHLGMRAQGLLTRIMKEKEPDFDFSSLLR